MAKVTDPAHEFATLCRELGKPTGQKGVDWLASKFDIEPHSFEFYQILFTIIERAEYLRRLTTQIEEASHIAGQIENNINQILSAFHAPNLSQPWKTHGSPFLQDANVSPILILSAVVRNHIKYPLLDDEDRAELLQQVDSLTEWLEDHQLAEQDFIREALLDGLRQFKFRIERLHWLGWGYSLQSLREVIAAYMALERGFTSEAEMPLVAATLKKVMEGLRAIYTAAGVAKDAVERADFILKAYGAASMAAHVKIGGIAGLLTFSGAGG